MMASAPTKFPSIFVISLERAVDRRAHIKQLMDGFGMPFEFIRATDGTFFTENEYALYSKSETIKLLGYELTANELACAISHIRVYEKMVLENIEQAIIFEDDAMFDEKFVETLKNLEKFPKDWGLINFSSATYTYPTTIEVIPGHFVSEFRKPVKFCVGYMMNLNAAKKLLELAYPVRCPADFLTGRAGLVYFKTYGIYPRVVWQVQEAGAGSHIGNRTHKPNLGWRVKRYLNLLLPLRFRNIPDLPDGTESANFFKELLHRG